MIKLLFLITISLFILTANGFLPGGSGTTVRYNTQKYIYHKKQTTPKQNTVHKTTEAIIDTYTQ
jgi:hypothetical protein